MISRHFFSKAIYSSGYARPVYRESNGNTASLRIIYSFGLLILYFADVGSLFSLRALSNVEFHLLAFL